MAKTMKEIITNCETEIRLSAEMMLNNGAEYWDVKHKLERTISTWRIIGFISGRSEMNLVHYANVFVNKLREDHRNAIQAEQEEANLCTTEHENTLRKRTKISECVPVQVLRESTMRRIKNNKGDKALSYYVENFLHKDSIATSFVTGISRDECRLVISNIALELL